MQATEFRPKLTQRQREILELIASQVREQGAPPTRAEIAAHFGFKSANAAEEHLRTHRLPIERLRTAKAHRG